MSLIYDLHTHSTASDGTLNPSALVDSAWRAGVRVLALTDHDTTEGIEEARQSAPEGMRIVAGVEISVSWNGHTVHVLGLDVDERAEALQQGLAKLREFRDWRAEEMGRRLHKHQIEGAFEGAKALSNGRLVSRTHFARFLVKQGYVKDVRSVFTKYLTEGKPGYVAGQWAELADVVSWILDAGGMPVLAHPGRYRMTGTKLRSLISQFKQAGGLGLEVISGSHNQDDVRHMADLARQFELLASAGSDFHDPDTPFIELGRLPDLPTDLRPVWTSWQDRQADAAGT